MENYRNELEQLGLENEITKDLITILDEHFNCERFKDNKALDHYSIQRLFKEYTTLNYVIGKNVQEMGENISKLIKTSYKED